MREINKGVDGWMDGWWPGLARADVFGLCSQVCLAWLGLLEVAQMIDCMEEQVWKLDLSLLLACGQLL